MKINLRIAAVGAFGAFVLALLTACGGGTSQIQAFAPSRIVVFGDEHSAFTADGRKYAVNGLKADGTGAVDCELNPLWIQTVASAFGFHFAQCLGTATEARAVTYAAPGATVAAVTSQIDAAAATGVENNLVLMMAGLHDVIQIYESRGAAETDDQLVERARERGVAMAVQVNRLVDLGARVVVATAPDVGLTPWALAKGATEAALLSRLSLALNGRLRVNILLDGRFVGLVLIDELIQSGTKVPLAYGLLNWTEPLCLSTAPLPTCTTAAESLVTGATEITYMWADSKFFGTNMHRQAGLTAVDRATRNPF
jgi:outer membrane lipase/esterase